MRGRCAMRRAVRCGAGDGCAPDDGQKLDDRACAFGGSPLSMRTRSPRSASRLEEGDEIEVIGSRVRLGSEEFVLARQVTRGDDAWTLRDASGRPMWGRGRMRP